MWIKILFLYFFAVVLIVDSKENQSVFYHNIIKLEGNTGARVSLFRDLISSDSVVSQFSDVLDTHPIGFYFDTLSKELFYNNYIVNQENIVDAQKHNFDKIYDVGKISLESGVLQATKQFITGTSLNEFFKSKVSISNLSSHILVKISDFDPEINLRNKSNANFYKRDFLLDLNSDGLKEKVRIFIDLSKQNENDANTALVISFFKHEASKWILYDKILLNEDLESSIDQIVIFKGKKYANIYINSSSVTLSGKEYQSQLLILGSPKNNSVKLIR